MSAPTTTTADSMVDDHIEFFAKIVDMIPVHYYNPEKGAPPVDLTLQQPKKLSHKGKAGPGQRQDALKRVAAAATSSNVPTVVDPSSAAPDAIMALRERLHQRISQMHPQKNGKARHDRAREGRKPKANSKSDTDPKAEAGVVSAAKALNSSKAADKSKRQLKNEKKALKRKRTTDIAGETTDAAAESTQKEEKVAVPVVDGKPERAETMKKKRKKDAKVAPTDGTVASGNDDEKPAKSNKKAKKDPKAVKLDFAFSSITNEVPVTEHSILMQKGVKKNKSKKELLREALKFQEKVQELDPSEVKEVLRKKAEESALTKAVGGKVMDDPKLLKKAIKRQERKKQKSKEQWDERIAKQERSKTERLEKRAQNIAQRHDKGKKFKPGSNKRKQMNGDDQA